MINPVYEQKPLISLVVAVSMNGVIGREGDMPWRLLDDLKWFKKNTLHKPIIMGRKTFQSIGRPLPQRVNIVITRDPHFKAEGVEIADTIEGGIKRAKEFLLSAAKKSVNANVDGGCDGGQTGDPIAEICIIGGGEIYAQTVHMADRLYITKVEAEIDGDTYFPEIDSKLWRISSHGKVMKDDRNSHPFELFVYNRS